MRRAHRSQHRFAGPAVHFDPRRLLIRPERGASLHSGLAVELVTVKSEPRELTLHRLDVGGAIASSRPAYAEPAPVYVEEGPPPGCRFARERFWDGYAWRFRRVQYCN